MKTVLAQRKQVATEVEEILDAHPLAGVLISMPGIGVRTAARILLEIGDASAFKSSGHLAANAALICLARRRCDVLFAMLRNKTNYRHPKTAPTTVAA